MRIHQTYPHISLQAWWRWLRGCGSPLRPEPCFAWLFGTSRQWRTPWFCPGFLQDSPTECSLHCTDKKPVRHLRWHWKTMLFQNVLQWIRWSDGCPLGQPRSSRHTLCVSFYLSHPLKELAVSTNEVCLIKKSLTDSAPGNTVVKLNVYLCIHENLHTARIITGIVRACTASLF